MVLNVPPGASHGDVGRVWHRYLADDEDWTVVGHPGTYYCTGCGRLQKHIDLTQSEVEVLRAYALGLSTNEIAALRFVSGKTISTQREGILRKLNKTTVTGAVVWGIKQGLVILEDR